MQKFGMPMSKAKRNDVMFILIDGLATSGKAVMRGLLDGHPNVFTIFNHDMVLDTLCDFKTHDWLYYKDVQFLRSLLSESNYYQLEYFSFRRSTVLDMIVSEHNYFPVSFDFYKMDRQFMSSLLQEKEWSVRLIMEHFFHAMIHSFNESSPKDNITHLVSMGFDRPNTVENVIREIPDGKIIYMVRPIESIIAVRSNRKPIDDDMGSQCLLDTTPQKLIETGNVGKHKKKLEYILYSEQKYPDNLIVVNMDDLVLRTEATMKKVARFLKLPFQETMLKCTLMGNEMQTNDGKKFVGEILDDPKKLLTKEERLLIQNALSFHNIFRPESLKSPKIVQKSLNLMMKQEARKMRQAIIRLASGGTIDLNQWKRNGFW